MKLLECVLAARVLLQRLPHCGRDYAFIRHASRAGEDPGPLRVHVLGHVQLDEEIGDGAGAGGRVGATSTRGGFSVGAQNSNGHVGRVEVGYEEAPKFLGVLVEKGIVAVNPLNLENRFGPGSRGNRGALRREENARVGYEAHVVGGCRVAGRCGFWCGIGFKIRGACSWNGGLHQGSFHGCRGFHAVFYSQINHSPEQLTQF